MMVQDIFSARSTLSTQAGVCTIYRLQALETAGLTQLDRLPISIRILLESALRQLDGNKVQEEDLLAIAGWKPDLEKQPTIPFLPARVIMQDYTGVPAIVDLAAMRAALARAGGDPRQINPLIPVDLVIDHSVQVDFFAASDSLQRNAEIEFQRNGERYKFLRWGQEAFENFRVVPPATGIVHQVNLEHLAKVVQMRELAGETLAFPDTLLGTDSHTPMVNSLGVLGWGVGGIEAEAAILGQPMVLVAPQVVGLRLVGQLKEGTTATDLVLTVVHMLRKHGVVGKFVEFYGSGVAHLSLPDRATISNMAPEYGATVGFFPVDDETLHYLRLTGREQALIDLVERYCKEQRLFGSIYQPEPDFSDTLDLDLSTIEPSIAGPKLPHCRVSLQQAKPAFRQALSSATRKGGFDIEPEKMGRKAAIRVKNRLAEIGHGSVAIAAITSCANTSNPSVMVAAGLLARNAVAQGLEVKPYVKTSLAPGSGVVTAYLKAAGLLEPLERLGFSIVGYGCTTCIGNSGPLSQEMVQAIEGSDLVAVAVLSGNRNFEGRINPHIRASYLASPPLVVAFALAGRIDVDLVNQPLGRNQAGEPVFLRDIWPSSEQIQEAIQSTISPQMFKARYADLYTSNRAWNAIPIEGGDLFAWPPDSTYIQEPPFFTSLEPAAKPIQEISGARVLALFGDALTTDHISPAGAIPVDSPAGQYLIDHGVLPKDFNSFGSRRGNDRVMTRGTFANIRIKNRLLPDVEGGSTVHFPSGARMSVFEAAMKYKAEDVPLIVLAGKEYGTGSSRDWAAKGTALLGVKAVIAESYERIHRSNLVGMGVLPLQFSPGEGVESLGLSGDEVFDILDLDESLRPGTFIRVRATGKDGLEKEFNAQVRIDTSAEVEYYRNGGILHKVLRDMLRDQAGN